MVTDCPGCGYDTDRQADKSVRPTQVITLRSNPYEYSRRLPHFQKAGRPVFVTFCRLLKEPFPPTARDLVLECCRHDHGRSMTLHIVVVMPEHVHLLLTPMTDRRGWPIPLFRILQAMKGVSAHRVNQLLGRAGPVWQDESFDHVLRTNESFAEKVEYIRQNPVRRGLCRAPEEYPWLWASG